MGMDMRGGMSKGGGGGGRVRGKTVEGMDRRLTAWNERVHGLFWVYN
jgi:hypothetical protein